MEDAHGLRQSAHRGPWHLVRAGKGGTEWRQGCRRGGGGEEVQAPVLYARRGSTCAPKQPDVVRAGAVLCPKALVWARPAGAVGTPPWTPDPPPAARTWPQRSPSPCRAGTRASCRRRAHCATGTLFGRAGRLQLCAPRTACTSGKWAAASACVCGDISAPAAVEGYRVLDCRLQSTLTHGHTPERVHQCCALSKQDALRRREQRMAEQLQLATRAFSSCCPAGLRRMPVSTADDTVAAFGSSIC